VNFWFLKIGVVSQGSRHYFVYTGKEKEE